MEKLNPTELAIINRRLKDKYGHLNEHPNFRLVFSEDEFEMRKTDYTDCGIQLLIPEVRLLPKYRQHVQDKYILEKLTVVMTQVETDLVEGLSYEPLWVFENKRGEFMMPRWEAIAFLIEHVNKRMQDASAYTQYPEDACKEQLIEDAARIQRLTDELFGNETSIGDSLAYREAIVVPGTTQSKIGE